MESGSVVVGAMLHDECWAFGIVSECLAGTRRGKGRNKKKCEMDSGSAILGADLPVVVQTMGSTLILLSINGSTGLPFLDPKAPRPSRASRKVS